MNDQLSVYPWNALNYNPLYTPSTFQLRVTLYALRFTLYALRFMQAHEGHVLFLKKYLFYFLDVGVPEGIVT